MTAGLGDTTHCVHARGDQQHARHAQEAREGRLRLVFLPFSSLGARVRYELRERAEQQRLEQERLEARQKAEAKSIRSLSDELHDLLAGEKLQGQEAALAALLQQALVHGVDGALVEEEIVLRVRVSAAQLAAGHPTSSAHRPLG